MTELAVMDAPTEPEHALARLEQARQLLAEARDVDEVLKIHDYAVAARVYAQQARLGLDAQNFAAEIKLRAERRAGELFAQIPRERGFAHSVANVSAFPPDRHSAQAERNGGGAAAIPGLSPDYPRTNRDPVAPTPYDEALAAAQVPASTARRWQQIALVPEQVFEQHLEDTRARGRELTTAGLAQLAREQRPTPVRRPSGIVALAGPTHHRILVGDVRAGLRRLSDSSVHCVVTSPPYYGLRSYGVEPTIWGGTCCEHEHEWGTPARAPWANDIAGPSPNHPKNSDASHYRSKEAGQDCACGAWLGHYGLESIPDCLAWARGEPPCSYCYVCHTRTILAELRRVIRDDALVWWNIGESYAGSGKGPTGWSGVGDQERRQGFEGEGHKRAGARQDGFVPTQVSQRTPPGVRRKSQIGIPERVKLAAMADGWICRSTIPWMKRCLSGGTSIYVRSAKGDMRMTVKDLARLRPESVQVWNGIRWTQIKAIWRVDPREDRHQASRKRVEARQRGEPPAPPSYYEIELRSGERIGCTAEHRWPTGRGLLHTSELQAGDVLTRVRLPQPESAASPAGLPDADIGWFVGLYLAEGCRDRSVIHFAGHAKETLRGERLARIAEAYQGGYRHQVRKGLSVNDNLTGSVLHAILDQYVAGEGAENKHLTTTVWQRSDDFLRALLLGYLEGDGHYDEPNRRWRLGFCQNDILAADLRTVCARLGVALRLRRGQTAAYKGARRPMWRGELRFEGPRSMPERGHFKVTEGEEIVAIRASRGRTFWDIEVEDEPHVFALGSGILTHNSAMPESVDDRPSNATETVFLLAKSERVFYDGAAVQMPSVDRPSASAASQTFQREDSKRAEVHPGQRFGTHRPERDDEVPANNGRQRRNSDWFFESWQGLLTDDDDGEPVGLVVNPQPFSGAHFAVFSPKFVEPMIRASTSERGVCPECLAPWTRMVEQKRLPPQSAHDNFGSRGDGRVNHHGQGEAGISRIVNIATLGWRPTCKHYTRRESPQVCPECSEPGAPVYGRPDASRPQSKRALELFEEHQLTEQHLVAIRAAGLSDVGKNAETQTGTGRNTDEVQRLADEAKAVLGGYYREFLLGDSGKVIGWQSACAHDWLVPDAWDGPEPVPATVLDAFYGAGSTGMAAGRLGRDSVGVELGHQYAEMAVERITAEAPMLVQVELIEL